MYISLDNINFSNINEKSKLDNLNSNPIERCEKFKDTFSKISGNSSIKFTGRDKELAPQNKAEEKLLEAAIELESLFINQVYKSMKSTVNNEDNMLYGGTTEDIFSDMLYNEYSLLTSKTSNLGLAKQMYEQMLPTIRNQVNIIG